MIAQDKPDEQIIRGISIINETAKTICGSLERTGYSLTAALRSEVDANLEKLLKRLAEAKISVGADATVNKYAGVLQSDLAADRKDNRNCSKHVLNLLAPIILDKRAFQPIASMYYQKPIKPQSCGNDVWYIESSNRPGTFQPLYIWRCPTFIQRKTVTNHIGLTINDRLVLDHNRGQVEIEWGGISVNWNHGKLLFTTSLKNMGHSTVHIRSIDIVARQGNPKNFALPFFPHDLVIYPSEQVLVPVGDVENLSKFIDTNFDNTKYVYTISMEANETQPLRLGTQNEIIRCDGRTIGFGLSVVFDDVFGDQYRLNRPAFVHKNQCITESLSIK
ncbi:MAG: hypothetical protein HY850_03495 [Betaproteobacteria bacterium]|nr:hypothetical protein [Betaproteobacteria bacterium]